MPHFVGTLPPGGVSELDCQIFVVGFPRALLWACDIHCGGCVLSLFVLCCGHLLFLFDQALCLYFDDLRHHLFEPYGHVFRQRADERHRDCVKTLVNALKLLVNLEEDGDGPIPNIVTGLKDKSEKNIAEGLRRFTEVDNRKGSGSGTVRSRHGKLHHSKSRLRRTEF